MSNERIYIAIPVHGRLRLAEECIPTVFCSIGDGDSLAVYDDGAVEDNEGAWHTLEMASNILKQSLPMGIEAQRRTHFMDFAEHADRVGWTHLYLTDADAPHDPNWRSELLRIQASVGGAPICGYNTQAHAGMIGNTIGEEGEVIWRRFAPGISYLLTREHVAKVVRWLKAHPQVAHWNWDWTVPSLLGYKFAVTKTSYVDHIGLGGMHHPAGEGYDGGDRALNPTPWLAAKRAEIVAKLTTL